MGTLLLEKLGENVWKLSSNAFKTNGAKQDWRAERERKGEPQTHEDKWSYETQVNRKKAQEKDEDRKCRAKHDVGRESSQ